MLAVARPLVWCQRQSPYSRYGSVHLDLYTTANCLSQRGLAEMRAVGAEALEISPHDARWNRVPLGKLEDLAARVMKAAVRPGNCRAATPRLIQVDRRGPATVIEFARAQSALA